MTEFTHRIAAAASAFALSLALIAGTVDVPAPSAAAPESADAALIQEMI